MRGSLKGKINCHLSPQDVFSGLLIIPASPAWAIPSSSPGVLVQTLAISPPPAIKRNLGNSTNRANKCDTSLASSPSLQPFLAQEVPEPGVVCLLNNHQQSPFQYPLRVHFPARTMSPGKESHQSHRHLTSFRHRRHQASFPSSQHCLKGLCQSLVILFHWKPLTFQHSTLVATSSSAVTMFLRDRLLCFSLLVWVKASLACTWPVI